MFCRHQTGDRCEAGALLHGEIEAKAGDAGGRGFGGSQFAQGSAQALTVFFAVNGAAEFAVANLSNWTDIFTAI
jgi:hypothetical protein